MGDVGTSPGFFSARPRFRVDDQLEARLETNLVSMLVEETTEGLYRLEATFGNWGTSSSAVDFLFFDRQLLEFGKRISVECGAGDGAATIFQGRISGLEGAFRQAGPPEVVVLAEDRLQDLRMTRRTRTFEQVSDSDVMNQIASEHGLTADIDVDGSSHPVLAQLNQSDLAFLRERARAIDAEVWVEGDTLHVQARTRRDAGQVTLTFGQGLIEASILADLAHQRTSLTASGWDVAAKEGIEHEAGESAIQAELGGLSSGASILASTFAERKERIVHRSPATSDEVRVVAEAAYRRIARRFVTGRCMASGDGRIRVGAKVTLRGVGPLFEGEYEVIEARHTFDLANGYRTRFLVERPGLGSAG